MSSGVLFVDLVVIAEQSQIMTPEDALAYVKLKSHAGNAPIVADADIESLLLTCRLADSDGLAPDDEGWTGKYDLNLAIAEVFEVKASMVATNFDFSADGASYKRSQTPEFFRAQARIYRNRRSGSVFTSIGCADDESEVIIDAD